jgi:hypothetical protein
MANPNEPILNQPINDITIVDNTPTLSFTIPSDADNNTLVFRAELDTQNPINPLSSDYRAYESRNQQGLWQYWNGSAFVEIPPVGIGSAAYNAEGHFTVPNSLRNAHWYWQISASDQLNCTLYNEGTYNQKRYCNG